MSDLKNTMKEGTVLHGKRYDFMIDKVDVQDGFGITYVATGVDRNPETESGRESRRQGQQPMPAQNKFIVREFFMFHCSQRAEDGVTVVTPEESASTVGDFLRAFITAVPWFIEVADGNDSLVHIVDNFEANGTSYYVTEYLEGPSLVEYIRQHGPLALEESRNILLPIFMAVRHLHTRQMLHTDLSPASIIITTLPNGKLRPVLTRHYWCKPFVNRGEAAWSLPPMSCPDRYSPLEQYGEMDKFLPQTNVYSLAAILLFALTGKEPPVASEIMDDTVATMLPDDIEPAMVKELTRAMSPDWHDRHANVSELRVSLLNALDLYQEKLRKAYEAAHPEHQSWKRRRLALYIIGIVIALLGLLAMVLAK